MVEELKIDYLCKDKNGNNGLFQFLCYSNYDISYLEKIKYLINLGLNSSHFYNGNQVFFRGFTPVYIYLMEEFRTENTIDIINPHSISKKITRVNNSYDNYFNFYNFKEINISKKNIISKLAILNDKFL